jgi:hypothetical protein
MTQKARNLTSAIIVMAVSAYWYAGSTGFRSLSRMFPQVVAVILFLMGALLAVLTLLGHGPVIRMAEGDAGTRHVRAGSLIVALVMWTLLIPLAGLLVASVLGVVGMGLLTFRGHQGTIRAILIAVGLVGIFYVLFAVVLNVPFPRGFLI